MTASQHDNVRPSTASFGDIDAENAILARLPPALRKYLEEEAPVPYQPSQVAGYLGDNGEAATLAKLRELAKSETKRTYGLGHPHVKDKP